MHISKLLFTLTLGTLGAATAFAGNQGTTLTGDKTAATTQTETDTYSWTVLKTLKPDQVTYVIRPGATIPVDFLLTATRTGPAYSYQNTEVSGQICLHNTGTQPTVGLWLKDALEQSNDGGTTWSAFAGPNVITVTDLAGGASQCYPYSFSNTLAPPCRPSLMLESSVAEVCGTIYRNHAVATIDNFSGSEGTAHSIDIIKDVTVTRPLVEVDKTASIADVFTCPTGFSCTPLTTTIPLTGSYPTTTYEISLTNSTATCGHTFSGLNTATLTRSTNGALPDATATATIFTGACHP